MSTVKLSPEIEARLEEVSKRTGRSKRFHVREAILEYLFDIEDELIATQRLEDHRLGKSEAIPLAEVMARYQIEE